MAEQSETAWWGQGVNLDALLKDVGLGVGYGGTISGQEAVASFGEFGDALTAARTHRAELEAREVARTHAEDGEELQRNRLHDDWSTQHSRTSRLALMAARTLKAADVAYDFRLFRGEPRTARSTLTHAESGLTVRNPKRAALGRNLRFYAEKEKQPHRDRYREEVAKGVSLYGWRTGSIDKADVVETHRGNWRNDNMDEVVRAPWYSHGILTSTGKLLFVVRLGNDALEPDHENSEDGLALAGVVSLDHLASVEHGSLGPFRNPASYATGGQQRPEPINQGIERERRYQRDIASLLLRHNLA